MRGRNKIFELKFGFSDEFRVERYAMILHLYQYSRSFARFYAWALTEKITETDAKLIKTLYQSMSFDAKFNVESEF